MATGSLRFGFTNLIQTATLKNGTGGGAPIRDEVAPWLMENAQNKDRTFVWQQSSGAGPQSVDYNLAGTSTVSFFAALGHRGAPSSSVGATAVNVYTQNGAYAAGGTWAFRGQIILGAGVRDGILITTIANVNSIRYEHVVSSAFTIGRHFASGIDLDLGIISSSGRTRALVKPILENEVGANPTKTRVGDNHYMLNLPYKNITAAILANLRAIAAKDDPFLLVDYDGTPYECVIEGNTLSESLTFNLPEIFDAQIQLRTLG
jgi:hypothetical protein